MKNILMYIFSSIIVLGVLGIIALLVFVEMPTGNKDVLYIAIGSLLSAFGTVIAYYFSSNKDSSTKNDTIANLASSNNTLNNNAIQKP